MSPIADPGLEFLISAQPHTFVEIECVIFSMVILLLRLVQGGLLSVISAHSIRELLCLSLPKKSVVRLTNHLDMTTAVDWGVKPQTHRNLSQTFSMKK